MVELTKEQEKRRVLYVGDRAAFGIGLAFSLLLVFLLLFNAMSYSIASNIFLMVFLIVVAIISFIFYLSIKNEFYYSFRVIINPNFILVQIFWLCLTLIVSGLMETIYGMQHLIEITLLFLLMYIVGYILGRFLWNSWSELSKGFRNALVLTIVLVIILPSLILGIFLMNSGAVRIGVLVIVFGIGSILHAGISALMLYLFLDKKGYDIIEDPPSKLIIIGMINTLIVDFIIWFIMILLVPLVPGGGKKKGGSSGGKSSYKSSRKGSRYRRTGFRSGIRTNRYVVMGSRVVELDRATVEDYWQAALKEKEEIVKIPTADLEIAQSTIITTLIEEGTVPTYHDLQEITKIPHFTFDIALKKLIQDKKVKFQKTNHEWWKTGYSLSGPLLRQYKEEIDKSKQQITKEIQHHEEAFLKALKEKAPIISKYALWDLANESGIRPRWRIAPVIEDLEKKGKIYYQSTAPKGYYAK